VELGVGEGEAVLRDGVVEDCIAGSQISQAYGPSGNWASGSEDTYC